MSVTLYDVVYRVLPRVEAGRALADAEWRTCAASIDRYLAAHNDDYATHRASVSGLLPPVVRALPAGTFERWMRARGLVGDQHKVPRVLLDSAQRAQLDLFADSQKAPLHDLEPGHGGNGLSELHLRLQ